MTISATFTMANEIEYACEYYGASVDLFNHFMRCHSNNRYLLEIEYGKDKADAIFNVLAFLEGVQYAKK